MEMICWMKEKKSHLPQQRPTFKLRRYGGGRPQDGNPRWQSVIWKLKLVVKNDFQALLLCLEGWELLACFL
jgi:hypothetical protein